MTVVVFIVSFSPETVVMSNNKSAF